MGLLNGISAKNHQSPTMFPAILANKKGAEAPFLFLPDLAVD